MPSFSFSRRNTKLILKYAIWKLVTERVLDYAPNSMNRDQNE